MKRKFVAGGGLVAAALAVLSTAIAFAAAPPTFLGSLKALSKVGSTVPANGDVNPYGIVTVHSSAGLLKAGDLLVSNFNAKSNNQGTGTTLVELAPGSKPTVFATVSASSLPAPCPGGVGLTTALAIIPGNYVVVGSLPTTNGKSATAKYGCLIVLDDHGHPVKTIAGSLIQGPWDMAASIKGNLTSLFVSNVFNGGAVAGEHVIRNSTVIRIRLQSSAGQVPKILSQQVIANGFPWRDDPSALAIGPTGVALSSTGTLYVANTLENQIDSVPEAMTRTTAVANGGTPVSTGGHLKQPLGLEMAPNGDIITTNAADGMVVETNPAGKQVASFDTKAGAGALFGLSLGGGGVYLVDDANNTVQLLH